jgi:hypothetical protein
MTGAALGQTIMPAGGWALVPPLYWALRPGWQSWLLSEALPGTHATVRSGVLTTLSDASADLLIDIPQS